MGRRWLNAVAALGAVGLAAGSAYLAATAGPAPTPAAPAPTFAIEPGTLDLGTARQNQTLTGTAAVVNRLPVAVDIILVAKSCSCADAEVEPKRIEPGQSATLTLAWRTGSKRGPVSDRITVLANTTGERPGQVMAELQLRADVQPDVVVEPAEVVFTSGVAGEQIIRVRPGLYAGAALTGAYATPRGLTAEADASRGEVRVKYDPSAFDAGAQEVSVMVATNAPSGRWIRIPVQVVKK